MTTETHLQVTPINEDYVIAQALQILRKRLHKSEFKMGSTEDVKNYLALNYGQAQDEIFGVILLDSSYNVIRIEELFYGTVDNVDVYPRVIVRSALDANASNVVLFHNHPSGKDFASDSDVETTKIIGTILTQLDITVLDHMIVCGDKVISFIEEELEL